MWERDKAGVACYVACTDSSAQTTDGTDEHSFATGEWSTHSTLKVTAIGNDIDFITIIIPYKTPGGRNAVVTTDPSGNLRLVLDGKRYKI